MARNIASGLNILREAPFSLDFSSNDQEKLQEVLDDYFTSMNADIDDSESESCTTTDKNELSADKSGKDIMYTIQQK
jgi:hypothetical protein